jgi:hypothetical protein
VGLHRGAPRQPAKNYFRLESDSAGITALFRFAETRIALPGTKCVDLKQDSFLCREIPTNQKVIRVRPQLQMGGHVDGPHPVCHAVCDERQILACYIFSWILFWRRDQPFVDAG